MLRYGGKLAHASTLRLVCAMVACSVACSAACSSKERSQVSNLASDGGASGAGGGNHNNPDNGGGPIWVGEGGVGCPPDSDDCAQPGMDGGLPPDDSGTPPDRNDSSMPEPDAEAPIEAGAEAGHEPDADVVIPDDGGEPLPVTYKIDLLFVVDNSGSMDEEQAALQAHFPMLISRLLSSTAIGGGSEVLPGAQDLHIGVVSTDLGIPGITSIAGCSGLGDNGLLNDVASPTVMGCSMATYSPRFLSYVAGDDDPAQLATDLSCIATLGIDGCGFEHQLESMLKAVWPGDDGRITFLPDVDSTSSTGQSGAGFPNGDFVRHADDDVSVLAVVLVTDEEDCSSNNTAHFQPNVDLPVDDPRTLQGLNTRCYHASQVPEPNALYDVERYVDGLRNLRPRYGQRVVFGAIVGVPPALVSEAAIASVDFSSAAERDAHYDAILGDPDMQYRVSDNGTPMIPDDDTMVPSCVTATGNAYAPRRIVEVARGFGERGFVQSICASDWTPAMELLATRIAQARAE